MACATPSYVFSDNGFDSSHGMYSKRGKGSPVAAETLSQSSSVQHQSLQQRPLSHSTPSSVPSPHSPYSPVKEEKESQPFQGSKSEFERRQLNAIEKTPSNQFGSVMLIAVPSYQENGVVSRTESHPSSSFTSGPISSGTMVLTNHHPVLRYPPNGDTLLSTSAISYGDGDILPEGNFDVHVGSSLGSLEDGLLSGNLGVSGDGGSGPSGFDLFDGEPRQESYLNDGNQEMQISSQTFPNASESFGLSDSGSNMSTLQDTAAETASKKGFFL